MATSRAVITEDRRAESVTSTRVHISDECLELETLSPSDARTLRSWIGRINGSTNIQPYLVEESPGRFRLFVGTAAERARTAKGLQ
jgi:hypothetical protein